MESTHEKRILELIQEIQMSPETQQTNLQLIADIITDSPPILDQKLIVHLMRGSNQRKKGEFKGLIGICGKLDESPEGSKGKGQHHSCKQNLQILNGLMECEKNPSYELFLKEFQEMPITSIGSLHLDWHILSDKACKLQALKLFSKFIDGLKRVYCSNDWRAILKKQKTLRFKKQVYEELDSYLEGKQVILKKVMSNSVMQQPEVVSCGKMTQSNMLNFSYLDSEIEDRPIRKLGNLKLVLKDTFIKWNTVYDIPEKKITLQHGFPACDFVKLTVRLPLSAPECFQLLFHQRNQWDTLLIASNRISNKSQDDPDTNQTVNLNGAKIVDTYSWNFSKRISFYMEQKVEVDDECRLIHILRSPFEPTTVSLLGLDHIDKNNPADSQIGKWENLIQIKEVGYIPSASSQKLLSSQEESKMTSSSPLLKIANPMSQQTVNQMPLKSGYITCVSETQSASKDSYICEKVEFLLDEDQDDYDNVNEIQKKKTYPQKQQQKREENKYEEETKQEADNDFESDSRGDLGEQGSISNSRGEETHFSNSSRTCSLDLPGSGGYFKRYPSKRTPELIKTFDFPLFRKPNSDPELGTPKKIIESIQSLNADRRTSLRKFSATKKNSEGLLHINLDNSIIVEQAEIQAPSPEYLEQQTLHQKLLTPQQRNPSFQCESDVTFLFNLLNSEAVHFFSKFIVKYDDDTLIQNMTKLLEQAKKIQKESSQPSEDSFRLVNASQNRSNGRESSIDRECSFSQGTSSTEN